MPLPRLQSVSVPSTVTLEEGKNARFQVDLPASARVEPLERMDVIVKVLISEGPIVFRPGTPREFTFEDVLGPTDLLIEGLVLQRVDCVDGEIVRVPIAFTARMAGVSEFNQRTVSVKVRCP